MRTGRSLLSSRILSPRPYSLRTERQLLVVDVQVTPGLHGPPALGRARYEVDVLGEGRVGVLGAVRGAVVPRHGGAGAVLGDGLARVARGSHQQVRELGRRGWRLPQPGGQGWDAARVRLVPLHYLGQLGPD